MEFNEQYDREEIYSKPVRAGKRTYFFDVKATKGDEYYLTITESKKRFRDDGTFYYEKHKIFLYKEDFDKFADGLNDAVSFISANGNSMQSQSQSSEINAEKSDKDSDGSGYSDVNFDDLGSEKPE